MTAEAFRLRAASIIGMCRIHIAARSLHIAAVVVMDVKLDQGLEGVASGFESFLERSPCADCTLVFLQLFLSDLDGRLPSSETLNGFFSHFLVVVFGELPKI